MREHLEADWALPEFDPAADSWVVTHASGVVGFAYLWGTASEAAPEAFGRVHPDHRGRGIGAFLVGATEARALERPGPVASVIQNSVTATDEAAGALLQGRGYRLVRTFWHMEKALGEEPEPEPPVGIRIRSFRPTEERQVHEVIEESFAEHWGHGAAPFEEWRSFLDRPGFDPGLVLLAEDGDELVGAVVSMGTSDAAWVSELGVRPAWRGRGIGAALLGRIFADLARRGFREVRLNVDSANETGSTRLYERAGMRVRREWHVYEKPLGR